MISDLIKTFAVVIEKIILKVQRIIVNARIHVMEDIFRPDFYLFFWRGGGRWLVDCHCEKRDELEIAFV